ncbi:hypothetical protein S83_036686, partial [Arachis hypogaea]
MPSNSFCSQHQQLQLLLPSSSLVSIICFLSVTLDFIFFLKIPIRSLHRITVTPSIRNFSSLRS